MHFLGFTEFITISDHARKFHYIFVTWNFWQIAAIYEIGNCV